MAHAGFEPNVVELSPDHLNVQVFGRDRTLNPDLLAPESDTTVTPEQLSSMRELFAKNAVSRILDALDVSPNNPNYHESAAYTVPRGWLEGQLANIQRQIETGIEDFSMNHVGVDLWHIDQLSMGERHHVNQYTGEVVSTAKYIEAHDIAYSGIKEVTNRPYKSTAETPAEEINKRAVEAIGATLVRSWYFEQLASEDPKTVTTELLDSFRQVYMQNILATVQLSARLEQESIAWQTANAQKLARSATEPALAAELPR